MSIILMLLFFSLVTVNISFNEGCIESERQALFMFKQDLINHTNRLASWTLDEDCCDWVGVVCDNVTGHVLQLHLRNPLSSPADLYASDADHEAFERSKLRGKINPSLLELKHLSYLDLSNNAFEGIPIPKFLGSVESLRYLNLSRAGFKGLVPHQLGNLSSLQILDLHADHDHLSVANLQWLSGLSSLEHLDLCNVILTEVSNWLKVLNTLPSLQKLYMSGCQLPQVSPPTNLNLSSLAILDLSFNSLENTWVDWIFQIKSLVSLDLSCNSFRGCIFDGLKNMTSLTHLDLSFNTFNSSIPDWLYNLNSLQFLSLIGNNLQGLISSAVGNMSSAVSLDFSRNELEGKIPRSMGNLCNLKSIDYSDLNNNNLTGRIPNSMGILQSLQLLHLNGNHLSGEIPLSLKNCTYLMLLDFDDNEFHGHIPKWLGHDVPKLEVLILRSNKFSGYIPDQLCGLDSLQVLDLAYNNLFGSLPRCLSNFSAMVKTSGTTETYASLAASMWSGRFFENTILSRTFVASIMMKGQMLEYSTTLDLVRSIDFSNNNLSGEIPVEVTNLLGLRSLNLSHNLLTGTIPKNIGLMGTLESVDFSLNKLSGPIPESMSTLTFLNHLNLSYNNLIGQIPSSTQLQSLEPSNFVGNQLCGLPLPNKCFANGTIQTTRNRRGENDKGFVTDWFRFGMAYGFVIGFWSVFLPLVIDRRRWRSLYALFTFQKNLGNR
ncbi:Disease resistance family protein / LRR family protein, putative [Theobroma cacao]|uniref:Disease resistance family protein / LRR family protein, putative n=1 Tax=Theobroma cacao TaxID=3641 RepID=A0A061EPB9_THECC|nr:Disease resistance family protein / LRR family protein, putative [Theobroma cacao]